MGQDLVSGDLGFARRSRLGVGYSAQDAEVNQFVTHMGPGGVKDGRTQALMTGEAGGHVVPWVQDRAYYFI